MKKYFQFFTICAVLFFTAGIPIHAQTIWTEYGSNPIFGQGTTPAGPKAYYCNVMYDASSFSGHGSAYLYKMWYGTSSGQTGLAYSNDGIVWTDQGAVMTNGYHAQVIYDASGFGGSVYYKMWYWGGLSYSVGDIRYTESVDGVTWTNDQPLQNGTVVSIIFNTPGAWNRGSYGPSSIFYNPTATNTGTDFFDYTYTMYYEGTTGGTESTGFAYSTDGITWNGYDADTDGDADPILQGTASAWDHNYAVGWTIVKNASNDFEMWYSGGNNAMNHGIGYATSLDGINWIKDTSNPIFYKDDGITWRDNRTYTPSVIKDGSNYKMWFTGKDIANGDYSIGYATGAPPLPPPTEVWVDDDYFDGGTNDGHLWEYDAFATIQDGIDAVTGSTVNVAAGIYHENLVVNKKLTLQGAGSGSDPISNTIISSVAHNTDVILITAAGISATDRLVIQNLRVTDATGAGNLGMGVEIATGGKHIEFSNVSAIGNEGNGIGFNATVPAQDIVVNGCNLSSNGSAGFRVPQSIGSFSDLTISNSYIENNGGIGLIVYSYGGTNFTVSNTAFSNNATSLSSGGDIVLTGFNGDAAFSNVTITGNNADSGIRMSGKKNSDKTPVGPAGNVSFTDVTISGTQSGTYPGAALAISRYTDGGNITFSNVLLNSTAPFGLQIGTMNGSLDIGGITFNGTFGNGNISLGRHGQQSGGNTYPKATVSVDAGSAIFTGLSDNFAIEDMITHKLDDAELGLVTWVTENVYITPNSGSIQRGIDAVIGSTVNVAAGIYNEHVIIDKSLTLQGAGANQTTIDVSGLPIINPHIAVEIQNGVNNVIVDGFEIVGVPNIHHSDDSVIRCGSSSGTNSNITISNNILNGYMGILFKNGTLFNVVQNDITFNKNAVVIQSGCSNLNISSNTITGGSSMAADPAGVYLTSSSGSIIGNTMQNIIGSDNRGKGITGSSNNNLLIDDNVINNTGYDGISFWSNTHHVTISNNTLSNNVQTYTKGAGISIKGDDITIINNNIINSGHDGIIIDKHTLATERIVINYNNISGNTDYGLNVKNSGETVDGSCNWWGATDGPSGSGSGSGDAVTGNVTFLPFLTSVGGDCDGTGPVVNLTQNTSFFSIQAAIGAANPDDVINVATGTYYENSISIDKPLTITGIPGTCGPDPSAPVVDGSDAFANGFEIAPGVDNVIIEGFFIRNFASSTAGEGCGVWAYGTSTDPTTNITVQHNQFNNCKWSGVFFFNEGQSTFDNINVNCNIVEGTDTYGIELTNCANSTVSNNHVSSAYTGLLFTGRGATVMDNISIIGNTITGSTGWVGNIGIVTYSGNLIKNFTINNNIIADGSYGSGWGGGIVAYNYGGNFEGSFNVNNNSITGNTDNGIYNGTGILWDATCNWWGDASGPTHTTNSGGSGDAATDNVTFLPWLVTSDLDGSCIGGTLLDDKYGVRDDLAALSPSGDKKTDDRIKKAIKHIDKSLADKLWEDGNYLTKHGKKVFDEEKKAVKELGHIVKDKKKGKKKGLLTDEVQVAIDKLVAIDESLARLMIDKAIANSGDSKEIDKAEKEFDKAQKEIDKEHWDHAIDKYKKAWEHAYHALKKVGLGKYSTPTDDLTVTTTPEEFSLGNNYPNPFNPTTLISYNLPEASQVTMAVYDLMGRKVKTLVQEFQPAGNHSVIWNATNDNGTKMSGGMYFYQIRAGTFQQTHKMILLK